jgi:adenylate cyclase
MTLRQSSALAAAICVAVFSLLSFTGFLEQAGEKVYDYFLRFRAEREHIDSVVFLDVDDQAVTLLGVFPWPRSVMAEAFLRLKEYGANRVILDIEYIEKSPAGVDELYQRQGLPADFNRSFSGIGAEVSNYAGAIASGMIKPEDAVAFGNELVALITDQRNRLLEQAEGVVRDNDVFLSQAAALYRNVWSTVNIQSYAMDGELAERRPYAEEHFSYPVNAHSGAHLNANRDILPAMPLLAETAAGAGYTNVSIDRDGVRRRIILARNIRDHWYLQLAFAPLADYLGRPEIILEKRRLTIKGARFPGKDGAPGAARDIVIPLDTDGAMMLDWPNTSYTDTFTHISFAVFSRLDEYERHIYEYLAALASGDDQFFPETTAAAVEVLACFDAAQDYRRTALAETSESAFDACLACRDEGRRLVGELLESGAAAAEAEKLRVLYEESGDERFAWVLDEGNYMETVAAYMATEYGNLVAVDFMLRNVLADKFCIAGRVDTGTTDIGVNPFYEEYVNVGTHGIVLDTILSESFIVPLDRAWTIVLTLILTPVLIILLTRLKPVARIAAGFGGAVLLLVAAVLLFRIGGVYIDPLTPVLSLVFAVIVRETIAFMSSEQEKQFIRKALSTYTSPAVADVIIRNPSLFTLGGDRRNMTALFTDVRSFSTISEALKDPETGDADPKRLVNLLNVYLTRMSDIILDNRGTIDKYEGDAIIAFFGAPLPMADHALLACRSAIAMRKAELAFNREAIERELIDEAVLAALVNKGILASRADPSPILTRIGINTGSMVVGNMGTENKMNYTIMGNAVNVAARLEGVNKRYGTAILVSDAVIREVGGAILARRLDQVRVVGVNEPVRLWELVETTEAATDAQKEWVRLFHEALSIFESGDWTAAAAGFQKALDSNPADRPAVDYFARCARYRASPPEPGWDGIVNLTEK